MLSCSVGKWNVEVKGQRSFMRQESNVRSSANSTRQQRSRRFSVDIVALQEAARVSANAAAADAAKKFSMPSISGAGTRSSISRNTSTSGSSGTAMTDLNQLARDAARQSNDRLLVLFELPLCSFLAWQPVSLAIAAGATPRLILYSMPALMYWLACIGHALALMYAPKAAVQRRRLLWGLRLDVALLLLQISNTLLLQEGGDGPYQEYRQGHMIPLRGLILLSAKWGLLDLGGQLFYKTLAIKVCAWHDTISGGSVNKHV